MKICSKCGENQPLDNFPNEAIRKDGKYPWCRVCLSDHRKQRYKSTPRKVWITQKVCSKCKQWKLREEFRKYVGNNLHYRCISCEDFEKELAASNECDCSSCGKIKPLTEFYKSKTSRQCIECHKAYHKRDDVALRRRDAALQKYFGITLDDYISLLEKQEGRCPVCLEEFEQAKYSYPVDHAHAGPNAGAIRAILHDRCNRFVMWKHNDPEQLRRAADLIENPLTDFYVPEEYIKTRRKRALRNPKRKRNA